VEQAKEGLVNEKLWSAVDDYIVSHLVPEDSVLDAVLAANQAAGLPTIDVSATQGRLLHIMVLMAGAKRVLEIGTLGGYSSICMARALPDGGRLISLEYSPHHAEVARANIAAAGLADKVEVRVGAALDSLERIAAENAGPFDFVFIDADKPNNANYLDWALRLSRPGTVIVCDNVVRDGQVIEADSSNGSVVGSRAAIESQGREKRLVATALQTVGHKGYDGFTIAVVK
jgi:predicted O-methyltransferase YrrM